MFRLVTKSVYMQNIPCRSRKEILKVTERNFWIEKDFPVWAHEVFLILERGSILTLRKVFWLANRHFLSIFKTFLEVKRYSYQLKGIYPVEVQKVRGSINWDGNYLWRFLLGNPWWSWESYLPRSIIARNFPTVNGIHTRCFIRDLRFKWTTRSESVRLDKLWIRLFLYYYVK